ncbi:Aminotransferase, class I/classII [Artemisia annua]|uniref:Aminotransferase, class I/classII n=1 Tax=Artemisia annua TaxID=35608 RepID=A0A2U1N643_ARTAN|nr:Aminotransferase, class I/classII [Artemisia annua]
MRCMQLQLSQRQIFLKPLKGTSMKTRSTTAKPLIQLGYGDPSLYPCFRTSKIVEDALVEAIQSTQHNCYAPSVGINPPRRFLAFH